MYSIFPWGVCIVSDFNISDHILYRLQILSVSFGHCLQCLESVEETIKVYYTFINNKSIIICVELNAIYNLFKSIPKPKKAEA